MKTRTFLIVGILVALLVAGLATFVASARPDGLLYVAETAGFIGTAEKRDAVLSGGLAGLVGAVTVLVLTSGLALFVRRRGGKSRQGSS